MAKKISTRKWKLSCPSVHKWITVAKVGRRRDGLIQIEANQILCPACGEKPVRAVRMGLKKNRRKKKRDRNNKKQCVPTDLNRNRDDSGEDREP